MNRIFVTGLGAITPIGLNVDTYWPNLVAGVCGASRLDRRDPVAKSYPNGCIIRDFDPLDYMSSNIAAHSDRATHFAVAASQQALNRSGIIVTPGNAERFGVFLSTAGGGLPTFERAALAAHADRLASLPESVMAMSLAGAVSTTVAAELGARGPVMTSVAACASGHYSILEGFHALRRGEADLVVAGGTESMDSPTLTASFRRMGALSSRLDAPETATRPFSVDRDGFVPGEGSCAVVLETEVHAKMRGVQPIAEVLGGCLIADAFHITAPDPQGDGAARAMAGAICHAQLSPQAIDIVFAHGTATKLNDISEATAIETVFGPYSEQLSVTAIKSMLGHAFGAAGAQAAVAAVCALRDSIVPPTINYRPDPAIQLPIVGNEAKTVDARYAMVNAFGFGGQNVTVIFGKSAID